MKNLKILFAYLAAFLVTSSFAQENSAGTMEDAYCEYLCAKDSTRLKRASGSMETSYWHYLMDQYEHDSTDLNSTERIIFFPMDSMWNYMDTLYHKMIAMYDSGNHFMSVKNRLFKKSENYYINNTNDTLIIIPCNLKQTDGKFCAIKFYFAEGTTSFLEEMYNNNAGYYYMAGSFESARDRIIAILNALIRPG